MRQLWEARLEGWLSPKGGTTAVHYVWESSNPFGLGIKPISQLPPLHTIPKMATPHEVQGRSAGVIVKNGEEYLSTIVLIEPGVFVSSGHPFLVKREQFGEGDTFAQRTVKVLYIFRRAEVR